MCGSKKIGKGVLEGYTKMKPVNTVFTTGSEIEADICTNCGYILAIRVKKSEKFK